MWSGIVRRQINGIAELRHGTRQVTLSEEQRAEVVVRFEGIRVALQLLTEFDRGAVDVIRLSKGEAEAVVRVGHVRVQTERLAEAADGLGRLTAAEQSQTLRHLLVRVSFAYRPRNRGLKHRFGLSGPRAALSFCRLHGRLCPGRLATAIRRRRTLCG